MKIATTTAWEASTHSLAARKIIDWILETGLLAVAAEDLYEGYRVQPRNKIQVS